MNKHAAIRFYLWTCTALHSISNYAVAILAHGDHPGHPFF